MGVCYSILWEQLKILGVGSVSEGFIIALLLLTGIFMHARTVEGLSFAL